VTAHVNTTPPPYQTFATFFLRATTEAKGLAALPVGMPSYGGLGRASSFAKATEDKDAQPSRAISPGARGRRRVSPPYQLECLPTGALAEHPPSPRLRRTRTLGPPARYPPRGTVAKGLAGLPDVCDVFPLGQRRRRRVSPTCQTFATFSHGARRRRRGSPPTSRQRVFSLPTNINR